MLFFGHFDRNQIKRAEKLRATELSATGPHPSNHLRLVSDPNLPHLNPCLEPCSQISDEFPKIHPFFRGEVEDSLTPVERKLNLDKIHVQLPGLDPLKTKLKTLFLKGPIGSILDHVLFGRLSGHLLQRLEEGFLVFFPGLRSNPA